MGGFHEEINNMEREINSRRKDADRYKWLRTHLVNWCPDGGTASLSWHATEALDAVIDAAMNRPA